MWTGSGGKSWKNRWDGSWSHTLDAFTADFFTVCFGDGVWDGLSQVTADMRNSIMIALGKEDLVRAEREGEIARLPLAPVVDFPSQR
ncbi:MAG TPA: hypothetical protein VJQ54_03000 [Candidatus Sulfotelmatobacter sp.]|nr:hypothetical protein [Candidatus Sulfotelmatobacter sp.]